MRVFLIGFPDLIGGASTECLHTVQLWRRYGVEVNAIPTWGNPSPAMRQAMDECGAITHLVRPECLAKTPLLAGSPVVSFCNSEFYNAVPTLQALGCPLIWSPCMTWMFDREREVLASHGLFSAWHFQSEYQREMLEPQLKPYGYTPDRGHLIRGAFDIGGWDFAPTPHVKNTPFVLGKLARCDADKWYAGYWSAASKILYKEKAALLMGYSTLAHHKLGTMPPWAEWLAPNALPTRDYYRRIHCLFTINGGAAENWPRVGLEAMAAGVPIVTENRWGWQEMIEHGVTGFLGDDDDEMAFYASWLARDEVLRLRMAQQARDKLESVLARPDAVWAGWKAIFTKLGA